MSPKNLNSVSDGADFAPEARRHAAARLAAQRVRAALDADDFRAAFQPIVNLETGAVVAFEGLVRPGERSGYSGPADLFRDAELGGMLWELEARTRRLVLDSAQRRPPDTLIFLNSTPDVVADPRFADAFFSELTARRDIGVRSAVLEITESSEQQFVRGLSEQVAMLSDQGLSFAIDDVGAGASGLSRIMLLRPQWLKLDCEFIHGIQSDQFKRNLVKFFFHFAKLSGIKVIAEGIEDSQELATLLSLGIRYGQGFHLAKPSSAEEAFSEDTAADVIRRIREASPGEQVSAVAPLTRFVRPALQFPADAPMTAAADALADQPELDGVAVTSGRRLVGWCPRHALLRATFESGRTGLLSDVPWIAPAITSVESSVSQALMLACVRPDEEFAQPLLVVDAGNIAGLIRVRDLLHSVATEISMPAAWRSPLTGLPGKPHADQYLADIIDHSLAPGASQIDAAIIDIRRFSDFNAAYGYGFGDSIIRELADMIRTEIAGSDPTVYVAHLSDDRFLVCAPAEILKFRISRLIERFERESPHLVSGIAPMSAGRARDPDALTEGVPIAALYLRVLLIPALRGKLSRPRDLYAVEQQLRHKADELDHARPSKLRSTVTVDQRSRLQDVRMLAESSSVA